MSLLDGLLGQINDNATVKNLAEKVGITPEQAESAVMALARQHTQPGDTVAGAAADTGLDKGILDQIVGHIGGEGSLGTFAGMLGGGEGGGIMDKLGGLAGGLGGMFGGGKS